MIGAQSNRMLCAPCERGRASLTFSLLDGLVLARTAFHHSMNYRAVVVLGPATEVSDAQEKARALEALIEHLAPGRMRELCAPSASELKATRVVRVCIEQASCKVRSGPPVDAASDLELDVWAGTIALHVQAQAPVDDPRLRAGQAPSNAAAKRALCMNANAEVRIQQRGEYLFSTDPALLQLAFVHAYLRDHSYAITAIGRAVSASPGFGRRSRARCCSGCTPRANR